MANKAWADSSTSFQVAIMACNAMTRWKGDWQWQHCQGGQRGCRLKESFQIL
jgi:hypothetical protein